MALGKQKRHRTGGKTKVAAARMEGRRPRGWLENAFRMGVSRPVHLLTKRLQPNDAAGRILLPQMMITTGILPLMLRRDEVEAMGTASGLKIRVLDAAGLQRTMHLKNNMNSSCQLVGPRCRAFINKRYRSPDEDPLWFARDLCLAITATTDIRASNIDEDGGALVRGEPMDSWRRVHPKPRSNRRRRTYPTTCCRTTAPRSPVAAAGEGGERHWMLDPSHGRGPLVLRFIRPAVS